MLRKSARGSAYNIAVAGATILLGFVRSVLLMRLLLPEQFGVITLALFFATFVAPFGVLGIDFALIQKKSPSELAFSTHFGLRLILAGAVMAVGLLAAPFLKQLYPDQTAVVDVFLILLAIHLFEAFFSTQGVVLRREMRFGALAVLNLTASIAMTITAPALAYLGAGIWSLVAEQAAGPLVRGLGMWIFLRPWKPSLRFSRTEAREQLKFGSQLLYSNQLGILLDRFDDFWTGTVLGAATLGFYSRAYELAQYPERVLATPITNVFFSTYSAMQDNRKELSRAFFHSSSFLIRVGFLMAVILFATATEITEILFGPVWRPIVPIFRLMLIYVVLDPFYANLSYLIIGVGEPARLTRVRVVQVAVFVVAVITFAQLWGVNGVAVAANLMMLIGAAILTYHSHQFVDFSLRRMFFWPVIATLLALAAWWVVELSLTDVPVLGSLILKGAVISLVYALTLFFTERRILDSYRVEFIQPLWLRIKMLFNP